MSLSAKTISIVKATAPVVAEHKDKITCLFYKKLFENNPGVRNVFQMSHQANATDPVGTQPRALANAVVAYAQNIENLAALGPAVELIAEARRCPCTARALSSCRVNFIPGQYIAIKLSGISADHEIHGKYDEHVRNYSLTGCTNNDNNMYKITVRSIDNGIISNHLHHNMKEGDIIEVSVPCGGFVLPDGDEPVVLVGAGVGITPLVTMMQAAVHQKRKVTFIYKSNSPQLFPLKPELESLLGESGEDAKGFVYYTNPPKDVNNEDNMVQMDQPFTSESLEGIIPDKEALFYICGPPGFIKTAITNLIELGISEDRLKYELFSPLN